MRYFRTLCLFFLTFYLVGCDAGENNFNRIAAFNSYYEADLSLVPTRKPIKLQEIRLVDQNNNVTTATVNADGNGNIINYIHNVSYKSKVAFNLNYSNKTFSFFNNVGDSSIDVNDGELTFNSVGQISVFRGQSADNTSFSIVLQYEDNKLVSSITHANDKIIEQFFIWENDLIVNYRKVSRTTEKVLSESEDNFVYGEKGQLLRISGYYNYMGEKYADILLTASDYNEFDDWTSMNMKIIYKNHTSNYSTSREITYFD